MKTAPRMQGLLWAHSCPHGNDAFEINPPDIVLTVRDKAAGEACPVYFCSALKARWDRRTPSEVSGEEREVDAAFRATLVHIELRCRACSSCPLTP